VDFTREPIIETVITPKEGCKLVVRSSKSTGQEEYFVDAVEVVSFGHSFFFRSLERPKTFFVPANDYEILEVRETRMVLKNVGIDRAIKIGGGREAHMRAPRSEPVMEGETAAEATEPVEAAHKEEKAQEPKVDKKRERRKNYRKRRGREGEEKGEQEGKAESPEGKPAVEGGEASPLTQQVATTSILTSLLPPPPTLISDTIARYYKGNALYKDAFYTKSEPKPESVAPEPPAPDLELKQPEYGSFEMSEDELEEVYHLRKKQAKGDAHDEQPGEQERENGQEQETDLPITEEKPQE
jgi:hypothetical protein